MSATHQTLGEIVSSPSAAGPPSSATTGIANYSTVDCIAAGVIAVAVGTANRSTGCKFRLYAKTGQVVKITGIRFYAKFDVGTYPKSVRVNLYNNLGFGALATATTTVTAEGVYTATFAVPYVVPAATFLANLYLAAVYEAGGTKYTWFDHAWPGARPALPTWVRAAEVLVTEQAWAAGEARPDTVAAAETYPVEPVVTVT